MKKLLLLISFLLISIFVMNCSKNEQKVVITLPKTVAITDTVVWYNSVPEIVANRMKNAFELKNPSIRVVNHRKSTKFLYEEIKRQINEGIMEADVIHLADVSIFVEFKKKGYLLKYDSPEYEMFPNEYKDSGYWAAMRTFAIVGAYNPQVIPKEQIPKKWSDIANPTFKDSIAIGDGRLPGWQYGQYYVLRDILDKSFWDKLRAQKVLIYANSSGSCKALLRGEIKLAGQVCDYDVYSYKKQGNPIASIYPSEGVPMIPCPVAIMESAPHKESAKKFLDFALSKEGQTIFQRLTSAYSVREDVPNLKGRPPLSELKQLLPKSWEEYSAKSDIIQKEFADIFGIEYPLSQKELKRLKEEKYTKVEAKK